MVTVKINGKEENVKEGSTIQAVLDKKEVKTEMVAVELNGALLTKDEFKERVLSKGDILEFLYYMAGGEVS